MNSPVRVPVHALKAGLSRYLKQLADGSSLIVTSHDRPVARLQGLPHGQAGANTNTNTNTNTDALSALQLSAALTWRGGKPALLPALNLGQAGTPVSEMVMQDRVVQDRR